MVVIDQILNFFVTMDFSYFIVISLVMESVLMSIAFRMWPHRQFLIRTFHKSYFFSFFWFGLSCFGGIVLEALFKGIFGFDPEESIGLWWWYSMMIIFLPLSLFLFRQLRKNHEVLTSIANLLSAIADFISSITG